MIFEFHYCVDYMSLATVKTRTNMTTVDNNLVFKGSSTQFESNDGPISEMCSFHVINNCQVKNKYDCCG